MSYQALDANAVAQLLAAYAGSADAARLDDGRWAFDYVQWLWYVAAAADQPQRAADEFRARAADIRASLGE